MTIHSHQAIAVLIAYGPEYRAFVQSGLVARLLERRPVVVYVAKPILALMTGGSIESRAFPDEEVCGDLYGGFLAAVRHHCPITYRWLNQNLAGPLAWSHALQRDNIAALLTATYSEVRVKPALLAANRLQLPVHTVLNSWKDPYKNSRLGMSFDSIGVFDADTAYDLAFANHWHNRKRISPVGSLHLDAFRITDRLSRPDFCSLAGLDPQRPFWCYTATEPGVEPQEVAALRELAIAIGKLPSRPQLLVRLNPRDTQERFGSIPGIVFQRPLWDVDMSTDWNLPLDDDLRIWRSTVEHSEGNFSARSTVALEFASLGKLVVNLNYLNDGLLPRQRRAYSRIFDKFAARCANPSEAAELAGSAALGTVSKRISLPFGESAVDRALRTITPRTPQPVSLATHAQTAP